MYATKPATIKHTSVITSIPGPRSHELLAQQRDFESNAVSYPRRLPIAIRRGYGPFIEDMDGNIFIDFLTGAGSLPVGHNHPAIVAAAKRQMTEFCHGLDFPTAIKSDFTRAQLEMLPASMTGTMKVHYCGPTGADAVEAAVKLCKIATGGDEIISFQGGYHGCTHAALAMTGNRQMKMVAPNRMPGVHFFPFSYCRRCPIGLSEDTCEINCISYLRHSLADANGGLGKLAGVIIEVIQGEGGVIPARKEFVQELRRITAEHGIPLIVDEIQTGCGRTGTWFAFEQYDIEPDVVVTSKGLSGLGLPVAIVLYRKELDTWTPGAHIGTFRGNNVAFAAGLELLRLMVREDTLENVRRAGAQIDAFAHSNLDGCGIVGDVRGRGLMWGVEIVDPTTGLPAPGAAAQVQRTALQRGAIVELGGRDDSVVRILPPLNIETDVLEEGLSILADAINDVQNRPPVANGTGYEI